MLHCQWHTDMLLMLLSQEEKEEQRIRKLYEVYLYYMKCFILYIVTHVIWC